MGCRERADRSVLLRVVAAEGDGIWSVVPDPGHRLPGRGASLHPVQECLDLAERRRAFARALRRSGPPDLTRIREYIAAVGCAADREPGRGDETDQNRPSRKRV